MYNRVKVTYPIHFNNFKCIGGECEDTCCKGWDIEIDKDTFEYYCSTEDEKMQSMIENSIFINEDCTSNDLDYGIIKLNDKKFCPFLDENSYCMIQSKFGEENLSCVCAHFPRIMNKVDNNYEISLDIACPEAARLVLNDKESIKFTSGERDFYKYIINDEYNTNSKKYKNTPIKFFKEIRSYSILIMQNRNYDLSRRFYILGQFIDSLDKIADDDCSRIPEVIENFSMESVVESYKRYDIDYIFQIIFFKNIVDSSNISEKSISEAFKGYTKELLKGFDIKKVDDLKNNAEDYMSAFDRYDKEVIQNHSHIFENYIVNFMYNNLFPFSESDFMFEGYLMLLVRYSFIRFYLVGRYINSGKDDSEEIVKFITVFGRAIEHDRNYLPDVLKYIKENDYDNVNFANKLI
ncbi:MAG: flagellin lysine-N-methylase [Clostridium sp.]|nr:flagellin lysine-N-methylase [Clostridium sp.]